MQVKAAEKVISSDCNLLWLKVKKWIHFPVRIKCFISHTLLIVSDNNISCICELRYICQISNDHVTKPFQCPCKENAFLECNKRLSNTYSTGQIFGHLRALIQPLYIHLRVSLLQIFYRTALNHMFAPKNRTVSVSVYRIRVVWRIRQFPSSFKSKYPESVKLIRVHIIGFSGPSENTMYRLPRILPPYPWES